MVLGSAHALIAQTETSKPESAFQPAEALSVTDVPLPVVCVVPWGIVVLNALIDETGKVQKVEVRRDVACLTSLAVQAVEEWKFSPATFAGKPIAARMPVAVVFRPPSPFCDPVPLPALIPQSEAAIQAEFQPAEVLHAAFPGYRSRGLANAAGAVVLDVALNTKGEVEEVKALRELAPFTDEARDVVKDWRFMPATFNGHRVRSKIVLAFETPPPPSSVP
jgi:hypothetical protein